MQLVSDNQLETVNCDKINITTKSIEYDNMNTAQNIVNGNEYTVSIESKHLDENTINSKKYDISELEVPTDKLIDNRENTNDSVDLIEESSATVNSDNGNTVDEENDENYNHIDMENDSQESTFKNENSDNQLNVNEDNVGTIISNHISNGLGDLIPENENDSQDTTNILDSLCTEESINSNMPVSDINLSSLVSIDENSFNVDKTINCVENKESVIETECNNHIPDSSIESGEIIKEINSPSLDADLIASDAISTSEKSESSEEIKSADPSTGLKLIGADFMDVEVSENDSAQPSDETNLMPLPDPEVNHTSKLCDNISASLNSNSDEKQIEDTRSVLNNENEIDAVVKVKDEADIVDNVLCKASTDDSAEVDLIDSNEQHEPMDVDVEPPSGNIILSDLENGSSKQSALKNDAMVYIDSNILDQIGNDGFLPNKNSEINCNDEQFTKMDIDEKKTIESSFGDLESEYSTNVPVNAVNNESDLIKKSTENGLNVASKIDSTTNSEAANFKGLEDCNVSKGGSIVIDTLDLLLSDDESEKKNSQSEVAKNTKSDKLRQCLPLDDDDDLLLVNNTEKKTLTDNTSMDTLENTSCSKNAEEALLNETKHASSILVDDDDDDILVNSSKKSLSSTEAMDNVNRLQQSQSDIQETERSVASILETPKEDDSTKKIYEKDINKYPIIPLNFMNNIRTNLENMTRENLEEFCMVKIVEAIIKRSNLSEAEAKLKSQAKSIDVLRKTLAVVTKQNRDLEIVMRNLTNEHKRRKNEIIEPVKISRSVGFQVGSSSLKNKSLKSSSNQSQTNNIKPQIKSQTPETLIGPSPVQTINQSSRTQITQPEIVNNPVKKIPIVPLPPSRANQKQNNKQASRNQTVKASSTPNTPTNPNGSVTKQAVEKRPFDTSIDLTDDEPPIKIPNMNNTQKKLTKVHTPPNFNSGTSQPRVSFVVRQTSPQNNAFISKQLVVQKQINTQTTPALANVTISPSNNYHSIPIRTAGPSTLTSKPQLFPVYKRHPAPLPVSPLIKTPSNPNWRGLPPKPLLKISRVANGIVISWVMETEIDKRFENIASYQIFAYQETASPPQSELWKKIGDVKALPLPMACTLTQFMAGYKYYFAVRAVDVRARIGPFSVPESIILRNEK